MAAPQQDRSASSDGPVRAADERRGEGRGRRDRSDRRDRRDRGNEDKYMRQQMSGQGLSMDDYFKFTHDL